MKRAFTKLILLLFFLIGTATAKAQMDVCVSVSKDTLIFAYKAKKDYTVIPVNYWNSQLLTVRYPKSINLVWGNITQLSTFIWEEDPNTPGAGLDGNDGFLYKTFYSANTPTQNFLKGTFVKVLKVPFTVPNKKFNFEPVTNTTFTKLLHLDAAVNNGVEPGPANDGNIFNAFETSCGSLTHVEVDLDEDDDGTLASDDPDDNDPCVPTFVSLTNVLSENLKKCNQNTGKITIVATGKDTLFYSIDNGKTFSKNNIFANLAVGTYQVVVKNKVGCIKKYPNPTLIQCNDKDGDGFTDVDDTDDNDPCVPLFVNLTNVLSENLKKCNQNTGKITITATGKDTLFYSIDNGKTFSKNNIFANLAVGTYQVVVKNKVGCIKKYPTPTLIQCNDKDGDGFTDVDDTDDNDPCVPLFVNLTNVTSKDMSDCATKDGKITIAATGNDTLFYSIDNGKTFSKNNTFSDLSVGTYQIVVKNKVGCVKKYGNQSFIKCDSSICTDKIAPVFVLNHPILNNKKSGDTLVMQCGYEVPLRANIEIKATDNVDKKITVYLKEENINIFPTCTKGSKSLTEYIWLATDKCGNQSGLFLYVLVKDTIPPTLVGVPKNVITSDTLYVPKAPKVTVNDVCEQNIVVNFTEVKSGDSLIVRTWTASDKCGNFVSASQTIIIRKVTTRPDWIVLEMYEGETQTISIDADDLASEIVDTKVLRQDVGNNSVQFQTQFFNNRDVEIFAQKVGSEMITYGRYDVENTCDTLHVQVNVKKRTQYEPQAADDLVIYSAFSPNDDNVNEAFTIENIEKYPNNYLQVFNRWGNEVYRSKSYKNDWHGTNGDRNLPDGTYFYLLKIAGRNMYSGFVQIQR